ncbi:uncharacterized protein LOC125063058 isoform X2 [Pieris napi]|uniref:uncharacterized protein LOC125063058 isoform X2 n=1 Tax=Pieris napi TaxID=78633 RepID=UPI001FBAA636|nr:uncharacterized protein LOC125063058 isoform X2 [Pieris napi]
MEKYDNYRFYDSLDYLIPPVKKQQQNLVNEPKTLKKYQDTKEIDVSTYSSTHIKRNNQEKVKKKYPALDPEEYILKSILPFDDIKHNKKKYSKNYKPVIKITVVPKSVETQTSKVFNKKISKKIIKNSCSNHDGLHSNNVCSVSGRKREKIFEIKSSESENFYKKRLYFFNKMDKNNFKDKRKKDGKKDFNDDLRKCKTINCPNKPGIPDVSRHRSHVKIVGRLGLTTDDRYVLNCAATIDDRPIITNITQDEPMRNKHGEQPVFEHSRRSRNYSPNEYVFNETAACNSDCSRMESQGIQVNLFQDLEYKKRNGPMKNKYSQCVCTGETIKSENETAKGFQTPIVVISVYPKENGSDGHMIRVEERQMSPNMEVQQKGSNKDKKSTFQRLASPKELSPNNKEYLRETNNSKMFKNNQKSVSPNRFSKSTRNHIPLGSSRTDVFSKRSKAQLSKKQYQSRQNTETRGAQKKLDTNRSLAKKALVDNYINKLETEEAKNNRDIARHEYAPPKDKTSKVTVNIDGESERYNLLFKHDRQNTDFSVRKTVKSKKKTHLASMENLLILSDNTKIPASGSLSLSANSPNPGKAEKNIDKRSSNLNVRDSIEVFHGRTSLGNSKQKVAEKNNNNTIDNNYYEGRAKHYRGDPCVIPDPSERDKEIRQLLGILTGRNLNEPKPNSRQSQETFIVKNCEECFIENECKKKVKLSSSLAKLFPQKFITKLQYKSKADLKHSEETKNNELNDIFPIKTKRRTEDVQPTICGVAQHDRLCTNHSTLSGGSKDNVIYNNRNVENGNDANLILNRNIHVFLEVEQFTKQKPIMLTRKQYNKVKRTIQNTVCKKFSNERKKANYYSSVTIGEVRIKSKFQRVVRLSKEVQTDNTNFKKISSDTLSDKYNESECSFKWDIEKKNEISESTTEENKNAQLLSKPRNIVSSIEVRYASVSLMKHVTYSSLACNKDNSNFVEHKDSNSIHTIFKGHKKSVTPNLGTSAYSLYSSNSNHTSLSKGSQLIDSKKKPLLQRLVSCLIMRSKVSEIKIGKPPHKQPTKNSSINSYNISTSFAGVEIPSSLYDTSASFYSNHTIMPVYKMKRSFFSSVKGFLTHHRN